MDLSTWKNLFPSKKFKFFFHSNRENAIIMIKLIEEEICVAYYYKLDNPSEAPYSTE